MVRVILPQHLRTLARVGSEVELEVNGNVTTKTVIDSLEAKYPVLRGTVRDHVSQKRRPLVRFFACGQDISHHEMSAPLPEPIVRGKEPLFIMGAIAGG